MPQPQTTDQPMAPRGIDTKIQTNMTQAGIPVRCLATDVCLTADPGVANLIPVWSHTFVEIDREIISMVI